LFKFTPAVTASVIVTWFVFIVHAVTVIPVVDYILNNNVKLRNLQKLLTEVQRLAEVLVGEKAPGAGTLKLSISPVM
jgi:hypothetical protein